MKIRTATSSDIDQITALIAPFIDEFAVDQNGRQLFTTHMIQRFIENSEVDYFVYENNHKIIGVIAYKQPAHLIHFFVNQSFQGKGIGRAMWEFVLNQLIQKHGSEHPSLENQSLECTVNSSCNAQVVYEKFGFKAISDVIINRGLRYVPMRFDFRFE
ncbi:GNAT family N-acetyltransferase [Acinetobacter sp. P8-3-8]|uniref:GNAT family N-acetyltransferase n=1 Tax=Acinetobacter sp. P8-3-8 TaxID=1029823 RepID=UPI0002487E0C|nr:GNAT family N-acetyltransferase [Acinetobacter sp. P8-3-8]